MSHFPYYVALIEETCSDSDILAHLKARLEQPRGDPGSNDVFISVDAGREGNRWSLMGAISVCGAI